jgi:hypothetical protein
MVIDRRSGNHGRNVLYRMLTANDRPNNFNPDLGTEWKAAAIVARTKQEPIRRTSSAIANSYTIFMSSQRYFSSDICILLILLMKPLGCRFSGSTQRKKAYGCCPEQSSHSGESFGHSEVVTGINSNKTSGGFEPNQCE